MRMKLVVKSADYAASRGLAVAVFSCNLLQLFPTTSAVEGDVTCAGPGAVQNTLFELDSVTAPDHVKADLGRLEIRWRRACGEVTLDPRPA